MLLLVLLLMLSAAGSANTEQQNARQVCEKIISRQMGIDNFQVDISMEVSFSSEQRSSFKFTYYFQQPDLVHVRTTDFVLLPTDSLKAMQPGFFQLENYQLRYKQRVQKKTYEGHVFELIPRDPRESYTVSLCIDPEAEMIRESHITVRMPSLTDEFDIEVEYADFGSYSMPVRIKGEIAIPKKLSHHGEMKDFSRGAFELKLHNYRINQGLPARVKKKLNIE